ncbi:MAG: S8 family serine peptidase, partial [Bacteroidales bacterium]|nr:S8 family serine peptidase [Bacteroidales bacterium]
VAALFIAISCTEKQHETEFDRIQPSLAKLDINNWIRSSLEKTGDVNWNQVSDELLWNAVNHGENILTIGYGEHYDASLKSTLAKSAKQNIIDIVTNKNNTCGLKSAHSPVIFEDENLTIVDVMVTNIETIRKLRKIKGIRYMEPSGYSFDDNTEELKSTIGAGCLALDNSIHENDVTTVEPGALVSWTLFKHNITKAWQHSRGEGITVGLIDTGMSEEQELMGAEFCNEYSPDRYIIKKGVYINSFLPWSKDTDGKYDLCGHGTTMGGVIAAPLNDKNMPVGVANRCNLIVYRACADVVLNFYQERKGVAKAFTELADNPEVKIISMSLGYAYSIKRIADAIRYAHSKGKLIFTAGGTSTEYTTWYGVIFPASMKETIAVTGIKDNDYEKCNVCHEGKKIDFTIAVQRHFDNDRNAVTLALAKGKPTYTGGSSAATATTAGIAALVWARHPDWTKDQVLEKMKQSAEFYPNKDEKFGYGCIDALKAVQ